MVRPRFQLGMMFGIVVILRDTLRLMALQRGWEYQYEKNDKVRLKAICKQDNCPFLLFASKLQHEDTFKIKEWIPRHTCNRPFNIMVRMKLLVRKFKDRISLNPDWNPGESLCVFLMGCLCVFHIEFHTITMFFMHDCCRIISQDNAK